MIAKRIYEHAKLHVDDDFPWVHAKRWMNEGLRLIPTVCENNSKVKAQLSATMTEEGYVDMPAGFLGVSAVYLDSVSRNNRYNDFVKEENRVWIPEPGDYIIEYFRAAKDIGLESDTPEVHEMYHYPLSYWIASREKLRFNPQDADGIRLQGEFYAQIQSVDTMLGKNRRVRKIKV